MALEEISLVIQRILRARKPLNVGLVSDWYDRGTLDELRRMLKDGDIIEIDRGRYHQWALCVNANREMVKTVFGWDMNGRDHPVMSRRLRVIIGSGRARINNYHDNVIAPLPVNIIFEKAHDYYQMNNVLMERDQNTEQGSEYFVKYCRNGYSNLGLVSDWYNKDNLNSFSHKILLGDLLESHSSSNNRWAVCLESGWGPVLGRNGVGCGELFRTYLHKFIGDDFVRINNSYDKEVAPLSIYRICETANKYFYNISYLGSYDAIENNAEHFATLCRNGRKNINLMAHVFY